MLRGWDIGNNSPSSFTYHEVLMYGVGAWYNPSRWFNGKYRD
jgi:hypothetical protein